MIYLDDITTAFVPASGDAVPVSVKLEGTATHAEWTATVSAAVPHPTGWLITFPCPDGLPDGEYRYEVGGAAPGDFSADFSDDFSGRDTTVLMSVGVAMRGETAAAPAQYNNSVTYDEYQG